MATYIVFLRAINIPRRFVKMTDLREGLSRKGFGDVESHILSGNLRFTSSLRSTQRVEDSVEKAMHELCGFTVRTIVRTPAQLGEIASYGAGLEPRLGGDVRRYVTFLKDEPDDELIALMNCWDFAGERAHVNGREVYVWLSHLSREAKFSNARVERRGAVATTRDWKVVSALGEKWGE